MDAADRLRALQLVNAAMAERDALRLALAAAQRERETPMAGEIRGKMAALRAARQKMIDGLSAEIDGVTGEIVATHADGLEALKLPRAELDATRLEIGEIREEFASKTNGGPGGPLPDVGSGSREPSGSPKEQAGKQPDPSWLPKK